MNLATLTVVPDRLQKFISIWRTFIMLYFPAIFIYIVCHPLYSHAGIYLCSSFNASSIWTSLPDSCYPISNHCILM